MYSCVDVYVRFEGRAAAPMFQLFLPSILLVSKTHGDEYANANICKFGFQVIMSWLHFFVSFETTFDS